MKIIPIVFIFILFSSFVNAKEISFIPGRSYEIDGKNITLIKFDPEYANALFRVNQVIDIVKEDQPKTINEVFIEAFNIKPNGVITSIDYKCRGCTCTKDCDNSVCFKVEEEPIPKEQQETENPPENITQEYEEKIITPVTINYSTIAIAILIIFVLLLGLIVIWKKI